MNLMKLSAGDLMSAEELRQAVGSGPIPFTAALAVLSHPSAPEDLIVALLTARIRLLEESDSWSEASLPDDRYFMTHYPYLSMLDSALGERQMTQPSLDELAEFIGNLLEEDAADMVEDGGMDTWTSNLLDNPFGTLQEQKHLSENGITSLLRGLSSVVEAVSQAVPSDEGLDIEMFSTRFCDNALTCLTDLHEHQNATQSLRTRCEELRNQIEALAQMTGGSELVEQDSRWGFIDVSGTIVIDPQFSWAEPFAEGRARVEVGGKYGFIDQTGELVIPAQFDVAGDFLNGVAQVYIERDSSIQHCTIDVFGASVPQPMNSQAAALTPLLTPAWDADSNMSGFQDASGLWVISPQFSNTKEFAFGLAPVEIDDAGTTKWGFINTTGQIVIDPRFDWAEPFSEGLAQVLIGDWFEGKWGFIDTTGELRIEPQFREVGPFSEGLAAVKSYSTEKGNQWGFINAIGQVVIAPNFEAAGRFSEGLAAVLIPSRNVP